MTTLRITGDHPSGVYLSSSFTNLDIGDSGVVGGVVGDTGVKTNSQHPATVVNEGTVAAVSADGIVMQDGGHITNGSLTNHAALISGDWAIECLGAVRITNYGTIASSSHGVAINYSSPGAVLVEESTGVLEGSVVGGHGLLLLASGAKAAVPGGTISGLGSNIVNFDTIAIAAGEGWNLTGVNYIDAGVTLTNKSAIIDQGTLGNYGRIALDSLLRLTEGAVLDNSAAGRMILMGDTNISPTLGVTDETLHNAGLLDKDGGDGTAEVKVALVNTGTVVAASGVLELGGAVSGAGVLRIDAGATLEFRSSVAVGSRVVFAGSGAVLELADAGDAFDAEVTRFGAGDTINLRSVHFGAATKLDYSRSDHLLTVGKGAGAVSIALIGQFSAAGFTTSSDGQGGTDVTYSPPSATALVSPLATGR